MSKNLEILQDDDVISVFKHDEGRFASGDTFKAQQLLTEYESYIKGQAKNADNSEMCIQGRVNSLYISIFVQNLIGNYCTVNPINDRKIGTCLYSANLNN